MKDEVKRILKMVEEGKIDSEKGAELIDALDGKEESSAVCTSNLPEGYANKMLKIKVNSADGDNVNINVPVKVIKALGGAVNKIPGLNKEVDGVDMEVIMGALDAGMEGKIVDVHSADGDIVEIVIE